MRKWRIFAGFYQRSELLTDKALEGYLANAKILESDARSGIKVAKLADGNMLKFFRVKRWYSSARFFSYARSFCRNAKRLTWLGIPTVNVQQLYHLPTDGRTAVMYAPLAGKTMMQLLKAQSLDAVIIEKMGRFIADLHAKGVYFRGLHFGNIVLMSTGEFGLIDVSEMTIYPWPLSLHRRLRNFERFWRSTSDRDTFGMKNVEAFSQAYCDGCEQQKIPIAAVKNALIRS